MIRFEGVTKTYPDGTVAVGGLDLEAPQGQITVLVGPVGLRQDDLAAHGQPDDRRRPRAASPSTARTPRRMDAAKLRRGIGYVIQHAGLFPHRTVADNIATVPRLLGLGQGEGPHAQRSSCMERVGLAPPFADRYPSPALRRPAAARRRRPGARRGPAGHAHGRALQRRRPRRARAAAGRVPAPAGRARQDDPLRHPRHRRGGQARRPGRRAARRGARSPSSRRRATLLARPARTTSWPTSSAATAATAASASAGTLPLASSRSDRPAVMPGEQRSRPSRDGAAWVLVVDEDRRPLGWVEPRPRRAARSAEERLNRGGTVAQVDGLGPRAVLDAALSSPIGRGVVVDGDGVLRRHRHRRRGRAAMEAPAAAVRRPRTPARAVGPA